MPRWLNFDTIADTGPGNGGGDPDDNSDDPQPPAGAKYVALNGNNTDAGTQASPWRTVQHGLNQISAGDTLVIRGTTNPANPAMFRETVTCSKNGTASNKLTVMVYPGEYACITGSQSAFEDTGQGRWELHDSATRTYRSTTTGHSGSEGPRGCFRSTDGRFYRFNFYDALADITAQTYRWTGSHSDHRMYRGPGFHRASDGRIYVRLQNLSGTRGGGTASWPTGGRLHHCADVRATPPNTAHGGGDNAFNPNNYEIFINTGSNIVTFTGSHYTFIRVEASHGNRSFHFNGASNIRLDRCKGIDIDSCLRLENGANNITFYACKLDPCYPPYCTWTAVKSPGSNPSQRLQGEHKSQLWGSEASGHHLFIEHCHLGRSFDGATPAAGAHDIRIRHNVCDFIGDDFIQWRSASYNIEIGWNYINGPGPGYDGSGTSADERAWFHHNVIDSVRGEGGHWGNGHGDTGDPEWKLSHQPLPKHGQSGDRNFTHSVKFYNNTFLFDKNNSNMGAQMEINASMSRPHRSYNNIVYVTSKNAPCIRAITVDPDFDINNNLYWRTGTGTTGMFTGYPGGTYQSLAAWKSSGSNTANYDSASVEQDPQFSSGAVPNALFVANPNFNALDYRPRAAITKTMGRQLGSTGWPGATNATWVGAVNPNGTGGLGDVGPQVTKIGP